MIGASYRKQIVEDEKQWNSGVIPKPNRTNMWIWDSESYSPMAVAESSGVTNPDENAAVVASNSSPLPATGVCVQVLCLMTLQGLL